MQLWGALWIFLQLRNAVFGMARRWDEETRRSANRRASPLLDAPHTRMLFPDRTEDVRSPVRVLSETHRTSIYSLFYIEMVDYEVTVKNKSTNETKIVTVTADAAVRPPPPSTLPPPPPVSSAPSSAPSNVIPSSTNAVANAAKVKANADAAVEAAAKEKANINAAEAAAKKIANNNAAKASVVAAPNGNVTSPAVSNGPQRKRLRDGPGPNPNATSRQEIAYLTKGGRRTRHARSKKRVTRKRS